MPRSLNNEEYCPNCGQYTGGESVCPNCGAILRNDKEDDMEGFHEEEEDLGDLDDEEDNI